MEPAQLQEVVIIPMLSFQGYNIDRSIQGIMSSFDAEFFQDLNQKEIPSSRTGKTSTADDDDDGISKQSDNGDLYHLNIIVDDTRVVHNLKVESDEFDITPIISFQEYNKDSRSIDDIRTAFSCGFFQGSDDDDERDYSSSSVGSTEAFDDDADRSDMDEMEFDFFLDDARNDRENNNDDDDDHSLCSESYIRSGMMSNECCDFVEEDDEACPTTEEGTHRRKVRFDTDMNGKVKCQALDAVEPVRTPAIKKCYWYNKNDYKRFREDSYKQAEKALRSNYAKEFYKVYQACESSKSWNTLNASHSIRLAGSKYRGTEPCIFRALLIPIRRRIHMEILGMQKAYLQKKTTNLHDPKVPRAAMEEQFVEKLGAVSRCLTERSRRLALLLGQGDAMIAPQSHSHSPFREVDSPFLRPLVGSHGPRRTIMGKMGFVGRRRKKTGGISVGIEV